MKVTAYIPAFDYSYNELNGTISPKIIAKASKFPKPVGGLMDERFEYVRSEATDIRKTFARIREQQKKGNML